MQQYIEIILIYTSCALALVWALFNALSITSIKLSVFHGDRQKGAYTELSTNHVDALLKIGEKISKGANSFLFQEYAIMSIFIVLFSGIVLVIVDIYGQDEVKFRFYATAAFIIGAVTSILCGFIGMRIAVVSNYRTTYKAKSSLAEAFQVAYRAGCVMGFSSVGLSLSILLTIILVYTKIIQPTIDSNHGASYSTMMELIAGYGLGGSCMALFGRVGGGIYTKAADVGADLVGKVEQGLDEDSPNNPATIADNVGDNVGDIAGMGSDLFGSFAESTCAALVVMASTKDLATDTFLMFPLMISAAGIIACFLTSIFGIYFYQVNEIDKIEFALKLQLFISTALVLGLLVLVGYYCLPAQWNQNAKGTKIGKWWYTVICSGLGLVSGFLIGMSTDYYTSNAHQPVREIVFSCSSGPAINIIYGLALGYLSTIIPVFLLAITILVSIKLLGMFGVALAAIGMLSTLSVGLAIDAYGPISDNAGGIAEMAQFGDEVRTITDALDAAGNTTAAIGKGFAIGSAALVSLALYGAFITRAKESKKNTIINIEINDPWIFCSLLIGAMLPYAFSAMTMKSVGSAAQEMVNEVREQFKNPEIRNGQVEPDYQRCIAVSTKASLKEMIAPGLLVIVTPILFGVVFHPLLVAGLLPGALVSGVQMAISMSNSGGAWDNTKKLIETGTIELPDGRFLVKRSDEHKAAVIGDTIGDPLKDTSGPSLNILIKLMAIISLVFAGGFANTSFLAEYLDINQTRA